MMSYEEFTQKEAALESAPQAEREAFYAEILEKETAKTDVRMMAYFHAALPSFFNSIQPLCVLSCGQKRQA